MNRAPGKPRTPERTRKSAGWNDRTASPPPMIPLDVSSRGASARVNDATSGYGFLPDDYDDLPPTSFVYNSGKFEGTASARGRTRTVSSRPAGADKPGASPRQSGGGLGLYGSGRFSQYGAFDDPVVDYRLEDRPTSVATTAPFKGNMSKSSAQNISFTVEPGALLQPGSLSSAEPTANRAVSPGEHRHQQQPAGGRWPTQPTQCPSPRSTLNPRRSSAKAVSPFTGSGSGLRLDSILVSSNQLTGTPAPPPRGSAGSPAVPGSKSRMVTMSTETVTLTPRTTDLGHGSGKASPRSMRVNLAHKALIGKGSYGMVFKAMDRDTNRIIAVKEITINNFGRSASSNSSSTTGANNSGSNANNSTTSSATLGLRTPSKAGGSSTTNTELNRQLDAVRKELAVLKQLDHPNIVKCLGEECDDSCLRIYMEYVAGGSVTSLMRTFGSLQERQASNFTREILDGLAYLHSKGILHRDLKGDNLLVDPSGRLKLADFGTARDMQQSQTHTNAIAGTAYFIAPEVVLGDGTSFKSDVWSVGCCVIEMLTGRPPLSNITNHFSIMMAIAESKGDELLDRYIPADNKWSPEALDFLHCCLARDANKRSTAAQLLNHTWIMNPGSGDSDPDDASGTTDFSRTHRSSVDGVFSTVATAHTSLPSPPHLDYMRSSQSVGSQQTLLGITGSGSTMPDVGDITSTSDNSRRGSKRSKRDKRNASLTRSKGLDPCALGDARLNDYYLDTDLFSFGGGGKPGNGLGPSPTVEPPGLLSPRWPTKAAGKRGGRSPAQAAVDSNYRLPGIRAHSSTATSGRSPILSSLPSVRTPSSALAAMKVSGSSQRSTASKGIPGAPTTLRNSGYDPKGSNNKSLVDSKVSLRGLSGDQAGDDVVMGKDDSMRFFHGSAWESSLSPTRGGRKLKPLTASPRMPPLPSPTKTKLPK